MPKQHLLVLEADKKLAYAIQQHPCLYDRKADGYSDPNTVNKVWERIALEFETDIEEIKNQYAVLKKRYSRKRHNARRAAEASTLTADTVDDDTYQRAAESLEEYTFMSWLDPFIRYKTCKEVTADSQGKKYENNSNFYEEDDVMLNSQLYGEPTFCTINSSTPLLIPVRTEAGASSLRHRAGTVSEAANSMSPSDNYHGVTNTNELQRDGIKPPERPKLYSASISNGSRSPYSRPPPPHPPSSHVPESRDKDDIFGELITVEIKQFPEHMKYQIKHEINNILFKYHSLRYEKQDLNR